MASFWLPAFVSSLLPFAFRADDGKCFVRSDETLSDHQFSLASPNLAFELTECFGAVGGFVHPSVTISYASYEGVSLRGIVVTEALKKDKRISTITWDDVISTWFAITARKFLLSNDKDGHVLLPFADLFNTAEAGKTNVEWHTPSEHLRDEFAFYLTKDVLEGSELLVDYCDSCDNERLVQSYGIYFEKNSHRFDSVTHADCNDAKLRKASINTLKAGTDTNALAPKCKDAVWREPQGGLRCSLARLAWEYCSCIWEPKQCRPVFKVTRPIRISCGMHKATSCFECPNGNGPSWCNGDCQWNDNDGLCEDMITDL